MITRTARRIDVIRRWAELPGVKWIRGATFYAYVDTPWRFKSKAALWKYMGIGLERVPEGETLADNWGAQTLGLDEGGCQEIQEILRGVLEEEKKL